MLEYYGEMLPPYSWRKNNFLASEWPRVLSLFKRLLKKIKVRPANLIWYFLNVKNKTDLSKVGSFVWDVRSAVSSFPQPTIDDVYKQCREKYVSANTVESLTYSNSLSIKKNGLLSMLSDIEKDLKK